MANEGPLGAPPGLFQSRPDFLSVIKILHSFVPWYSAGRCWKERMPDKKDPSAPIILSNSSGPLSLLAAKQIPRPEAATAARK